VLQRPDVLPSWVLCQPLVTSLGDLIGQEGPHPAALHRLVPAALTLLPPSWEVPSHLTGATPPVPSGNT
jgi:hypothetical protein